MSYNFIADRIEVRASKKGESPRYIVKATALVPNKKDIYEYQKRKDGSIKSFKSMFTDNCIKSIKEQSKHKHLFVDSQHELALNTNIKSLLKGKLSDEELKRIDIMLKTKQMPLAKLNEIEVTEDGLQIETELNPMFREFDIDHQKYFDAVWYNLENKYLNGVSINFVPTDITYDVDGDQVINDVDIFGFSYVDNPALADNGIYEVAIRSMQEGINVRSGVNMEDEKVKLDAEKAKLVEERAKIEAEKSAIEKQKEDMKQAEIARQAAEHKRTQDELAAKAEALKQAEADKVKLQEELNRAKGIIGQQTPPSQRQGEQKYDEKFYEENIKKITAKHDATMEVIRKGQQPLVDNRMSGFGELINLQAKISPVAGLRKEDADYIQEHRLLERGNADIVIRK